MLQLDIVSGSSFLAVSSLILLGYLLFQGKPTRLDARLQNLGGKPADEQGPQSVARLALSALPVVGGSLLPKDEEERTKLQTRLLHAGCYSRQALGIFLGLKLLLTVGPACAGFLAGVAGFCSVTDGVSYGAVGGIIGLIGPSFWLDSRKKSRQQSLRRALPDALDILVICLEGGVSLPGAIRRLGTELRTAHPALAMELLIVQREIQLGRTPGDALRHFGERSDLEEVRGLASVINQAERFGASLVKALRVHADTMRSKRMQYAEEMAQKAAVKILFPTLLCIFPNIFVVILGPAVFQIMETLPSVRN